MSYSVVQGPSSDSNGKFSRSWKNLKSKGSGMSSGGLSQGGPPGTEAPRVKMMSMVRKFMPKKLPQLPSVPSFIPAPYKVDSQTQFYKTSGVQGTERLCCPYKKRERLHFRKISKKAAALCSICGELTNGIISRCALHDFNACNKCYNLFYYLPTDAAMVELFSKYDDLDTNANDVLVEMMSNYPQYGNVSSHECAETVAVQALGYALWYNEALLEPLYRVVENNNLLAPKSKKEALENLLCIACMPDPMKNKDVRYEVVTKMLRLTNVDPSTHNNIPIGVAAAGGHRKIVGKLLKDSRVDASDDNNYAVRMAASHGHVKVVRKLLEEPRVDPGAMYSYALRIACKKGYLDVVRLLLKSKKVKPAALENTAIGLAASYGHADIVALLLVNKDVDKRDCWDYALRQAIIYGYKQIVEMLVSDETIEGAIEYARKYSVSPRSMVSYLIELENDDEVSDTDRSDDEYGSGDESD